MAIVGKPRPSQNLRACHPTWRPPGDSPRTHQIRVHLRSVGLHTVGDVDYAGSPLSLSQIKSSYTPKWSKPERPLMGRVALHAERLEIKHPATGEPIAITAEWPKDLRVTVKYLRMFCGL